MENLGDHVNLEPDVTDLQFLSVESIKLSPNPVQVNVEFATNFARRLAYVDGSKRFHDPEEKLVGG
jgi:ABC-type taurine transport system ATPase subunit